jgi:hypothetical protein
MKIYSRIPQFKFQSQPIQLGMREWLDGNPFPLSERGLIGAHKLLSVPGAKISRCPALSLKPGNQSLRTTGPVTPYNSLFPPSPESFQQPPVVTVFPKHFAPLPLRPQSVPTTRYLRSTSVR